MSRVSTTFGASAVPEPWSAIVGSVIIAGEQKSTFSTVLGAIAVFASVTNIVSGFLITDRMLKMFKEKSRS